MAKNSNRRKSRPNSTHESSFYPPTRVDSYRPQDRIQKRDGHFPSYESVKRQGNRSAPSREQWRQESPLSKRNTMSNEAKQYSREESVLRAPKVAYHKLRLDHPLLQEIHNLRNARWKRKLEWIRVARQLGTQWELPSCQERKIFQIEEEESEDRLCELAAMIALEERDLLSTDPVMRKVPRSPYPFAPVTPSKIKEKGDRKSELTKINDRVNAWMVNSGNLAALGKTKPAVPLFIGENNSGSEADRTDGEKIFDSQDREIREAEMVPEEQYTPTRKPAAYLPRQTFSNALTSEPAPVNSRPKAIAPATGETPAINHGLGSPHNAHKRSRDKSNEHALLPKREMSRQWMLDDLGFEQLRDREGKNVLPGSPWLRKKIKTSECAIKEKMQAEKEMMLIDLTTPSPQKIVTPRISVSNSKELLPSMLSSHSIPMGPAKAAGFIPAALRPSPPVLEPENSFKDSDRLPSQRFYTEMTSARGCNDHLNHRAFVEEEMHQKQQSQHQVQDNGKVTVKDEFDVKIDFDFLSAFLNARKREMGG